VEDILRVICSQERKTGDFRLNHACGCAWTHRGWEFLQKQNYFYKKLSAWIWKRAYPVNCKTGHSQTWLHCTKQACDDVRQIPFI